MLNRVLHSIANRANSFQSPLFPSTSLFEPTPFVGAAEKIHKLLHLDDTTTDYYVFAALTALHSFPEILENLGEDNATFHLTDYRRPEDSWYGVEPKPDRGPFCMCRHLTSFPVFFQIELSHLAADILEVKIGTERHLVPTRLDGTRLIVAWPPELGIAGSLELVGQSWDPAFSAFIQHVPTNFPYSAVAAILDANLYKNELLLQHGLLDHYFQARSGMEKMAIVLLALGLSNKSNLS